MNKNLVEITDIYGKDFIINLNYILAIVPSSIIETYEVRIKGLMEGISIVINKTEYRTLSEMFCVQYE
jgi:hypothetical protein